MRNALSQNAGLASNPANGINNIPLQDGVGGGGQALGGAGGGGVDGTPENVIPVLQKIANEAPGQWFSHFDELNNIDFQSPDMSELKTQILGAMQTNQNAQKQTTDPSTGKKDPTPADLANRMIEKVNMMKQQNDTQQAQQKKLEAEEAQQNPQAQGQQNIVPAFNLHEYRTADKGKKKHDSRGNPFKVLMGKIGKLRDHGLGKSDVKRYLTKTTTFNEELIEKAIDIVTDRNKKTHRDEKDDVEKDDKATEASVKGVSRYAEAEWLESEMASQAESSPVVVVEETVCEETNPSNPSAIKPGQNGGRRHEVDPPLKRISFNLREYRLAEGLLDSGSEPLGGGVVGEPAVAHDECAMDVPLNEAAKTEAPAVPFKMHVLKKHDQHELLDGTPIHEFRKDHDVHLKVSPMKNQAKEVTEGDGWKMTVDYPSSPKVASYNHSEFRAAQFANSEKEDGVYGIAPDFAKRSTAELMSRSCFLMSLDKFNANDKHNEGRKAADKSGVKAELKAIRKALETRGFNPDEMKALYG